MTAYFLQGCPLIHERGWRSLLNSTLQGIPDMLYNVHIWRVWWPAEVSKLRRVFLRPLCGNSGHMGCRTVLLELPKSVRMHNRHEWMQVISQGTYVRVTGVISRRIRVPYHSNCTCPTPLQSLLQLEQSPADMQGPWIHEFFSIPVHVHPLDTIGNKTCQTRQRFQSSTVQCRL